MGKKIIKISLLACAGLFFCFQDGAFKTSQLKYSRVKAAYEKKWKGLQDLLKSKDLNPADFEIYLRVFKHENELECWARNRNDKQYKLLKTFPICASSGELGPKRKQGDGQVPEGFYEIASFQPLSNFHLALRVGYPNKSDQIKATDKDPGGDIMIHGNCVTIGCIPIQDDPIEELYVLAVEARDNGFKISADIFPFKFEEKNAGLMNPDSEHLAFWNILKTAYEHFENQKTLPKIATDKKGDYIVTTN
jgi:murein L,D-transpeptidase YafK